MGLVGMAGALLIAAAALAFVALRQSANLFYTPTELAERGGPEPGLAGKVGGLVEAGSIAYVDGTQITFRLIDDAHAIKVQYEGLRPDLFTEGAGAIAEGAFDETGTFVADRLLAKHDETYVPRELKSIQEPEA